MFWGKCIWALPKDQMVGFNQAERHGTDKVCNSNLYILSLPTVNSRQTLGIVNAAALCVDPLRREKAALEC